MLLSKAKVRHIRYRMESVGLMLPLSSKVRLLFSDSRDHTHLTGSGNKIP